MNKKRPASRSFNEAGFSLLEILIVVTLLVIIAIALLVTLNPMTQINKGQDSKRKQELTQLSKALEDWYNDKNCYPSPSQICYNATGSTTCNICGNQSTSPSFSPYLSRLPCDPRQPLKKYLYQVDSNNCPSWYRIYTMLSNQSDSVVVSVGCSNGCGPSPNFNYNYGVSSPNIGLEENTNFCSLATAIYVNPFCNICGTYSQCKISYPNEIYYTDPGGCLIACIKD